MPVFWHKYSLCNHLKYVNIYSGNSLITIQNPKINKNKTLFQELNTTENFFKEDAFDEFTENKYIVLDSGFFWIKLGWFSFCLGWALVSLIFAIAAALKYDNEDNLWKIAAIILLFCMAVSFTSFGVSILLFFPD